MSNFISLIEKEIEHKKDKKKILKDLHYQDIQNKPENSNEEESKNSENEQNKYSKLYTAIAIVYCLVGFIKFLIELLNNPELLGVLFEVLFILVGIFLFVFVGLIGIFGIIMVIGILFAMIDLPNTNRKIRNHKHYDYKFSR